MTLRIQWLKLDGSKGPKRVGVSLPLPEEGDIFSFWNVVFCSYLDHHTLDKGKKSSDSKHSM
jgi:hypothetical protein